MSDAFDSWNNKLRWATFVPMLFLAYLFAYYTGRIALFFSFGWYGLDEDTLIGFLIYHFYQNFGCFAIAIIVSAACAPRGKIVVGSIYLGLLLMMLGFSTFSLITYGDPNGFKPWQVIYDYSLNIIAGIFALISIILTENEKRKSVIDRIAEVMAEKKLEYEEKMKDPDYAKKDAFVRDKLGL